MTADPYRGALYSPPQHRPSDDDVTECTEQLAACMDAANDLRAVMTRAHRTLEAYLGYTGVQRIAHGMQIDRALADLAKIMETLR